MRHEFELCYELDMPLAVSVGLYLDCEHYVFLHRELSDSIEVVESGDGYYRCRQNWNLFGLAFGQTYKCEYVAPATFINSDVEPFPRWLPSFHHLTKIRTTLRYYETERRTTLSRFHVEVEMPFWLAPFKGWVRRTVERVKILKDLEDVALVDRRARLFGRFDNSPFLRRHQFLLHKEEYVKHFGENSEFFGDASWVGHKGRWTDIKDLPRPYVRDFLARRYPCYTNFTNA